MSRAVTLPDPFIIAQNVARKLRVEIARLLDLDPRIVRADVDLTDGMMVTLDLETAQILLELLASCKYGGSEK